MYDTSSILSEASRSLAEKVDALHFGDPVALIYNPIVYARRAWEAYLRKYSATKKRVVFLGMNPGPWGMVQTGVPFGEVALVRDWLGIEAKIDTPDLVHPKRPIEGFSCKRSEVSGRRLWGLMGERFGSAESFFREHFVANYCPLAFLEKSGRNRTPDKLPVSERNALFAHCDEYLRITLDTLTPEWIVAIGAFAKKRCLAVITSHGKDQSISNKISEIQIMGITHPSPANPAANRGWAEIVTSELVRAGVW